MINKTVLAICLLHSMTLYAATQGNIKVGKLWAGEYVTNYGYIGNLEYPGGSRDFYILQLSMMFSCSVNDESFVLFGGTLGQSELDYGIQQSDGLHQAWTQDGDNRTTSVLTAMSDFSELSGSTPLEMQHTTQIRAYNHPDYDDFILITHTFHNTGSDTINNFYFGYHMPADMGAHGVTTRELDDFAAYEPSQGIAYMYDDNSDDGLTPYYVGQALLSAPPAGGSSDDEEITSQRWTTFNYYLMVNPISGKDDLREKLSTNEIDSDAVSKGPYSVISGVGPYTILPEGKISFTVAIVYGTGLPGLQKNTSNASNIVSNHFEVPEDEKTPIAPEIESIEISGKLVNITWDSEAENAPTFSGYKIYRSTVSAIGEWELIATQSANPAGNSFLDLDVKVGFPYFYAVTSYDINDNESGKWGEVCRTLEPLRPLNNPGVKMERIRVVPNPYLGGANWELEDYESTIYFTRLPEKCYIYIYTLTGELVVKLDHNMGNDQSLDYSGDERWNLLSMNNQAVVSGMYLYRVETPIGTEYSGRFVVIRGER